MSDEPTQPRRPGIPDQPDLDPEQIVEALERSTVDERLTSKEQQVADADVEDAPADEPILDQDMEPDERRTPEPPS